MIGKELPKANIVNNDFKDVAFGRRAARYLDPNFKISHEEITEMISETNAITPTAVNTQPFRFLIIDTDEGKKKIDQIMRPPFDRDRCTSCSFVAIPLADRRWIDDFDTLYQHELEIVPDYPEMMVPVTYDWYEELTADGNEKLDKSINFQCGMVTMSFQLVVRAHGYDVSFMDGWDPALLEEAFGVDLERYIPEGVMTIGKLTGPVTERFRYTGEHFIDWA